MNMFGIFLLCLFLFFMGFITGQNCKNKVKNSKGKNNSLENIIREDIIKNKYHSHIGSY